MEKTTVLARVQFTVSFTERTVTWLNQFTRDAWFAREEGSPFLQEFGARWLQLIEVSVNEEIQAYFRHLGVSENDMPYLDHADTYRGSWIMNAAIVMRGSIGHSYSVLSRSQRDLSEVAEGLSGLKNRILRRVEPQLNAAVSESLYSVANHYISGSNREGMSGEGQRSVPPTPSPVISTNFVLDARPLASLTPARLSSHRIHLSVGVSRDFFTLENLGDDPLRDVHIGVFSSPTQRNQWSYVESYMGSFPLVSGHQTLSKSVSDFVDQFGKKLDLSDGKAVYVDCWIQDSHGIYLFQFFIEAES